MNHSLQEEKELKVPANIIEKWQNIVDIMVEITGVRDALINRVVLPNIKVLQASQNKENPFARGDQVKLIGNYCEVVVNRREELLISNALQDENWKETLKAEEGIISYLGYPLEWPDGDIFGTICIHDIEENNFSKNTKKLIQQFQELVESHLKRIFHKQQHITDKYNLQKEISQRAERLKPVIDTLEHGFWDYNLDTGNGYLSPRCYTMLGYEPGEVPMTKDTWINLIYPKDRKEVVPRIERCIEKGELFEEEFRLRCKDGSWKWIFGRGKSFEIDDKSVSHRVVGVNVDMTKRKKDTKKLRNQKEELQDQKEELQAFNEQLTAYSEEITIMNQELNELNKRFINMINVISKLNKDCRNDETSFLSDLLHNALNIVPEADYGKIYTVDENGYYKFIDAIGHDLDILKKNKVSKEIFFNNSNQSICISNEYSLDMDKIPDDMKETFIEALKPVSESIYVNITVDNKIIGRISLNIAEDSNKEFSNNTKRILKSLTTLTSAFFSLQRYNKLQGQFTKELITSIIQIMEMYDRYTSGHSENVAQVASEIAEKMGIAQQKIADTYWAGMVHDIGKLLVPLNILNKKGSLTDKEYKLIKKHSSWGCKALGKSESLKHIAKYVLHHHERWDGRGYPEGLKGDEIPLISQILAVADAWDAMTSNRAYRNALSEAEAIQKIKDNSGTQFSPKIVNVFLTAWGI